MEDVSGHMWYLRYPLTDGSGHVTVATTRPETMLGDTAVAVNPNDPRAEALLARLKAGNPYRPLTIHRYFPPDGLDGALGFLDVRGNRFKRLIDEGFNNTVAHDCEANQCILAGKHKDLLLG